MKINAPSASELGHSQLRPGNGTSGMFARGVGARDSTTSADSDSPLCHITLKAAHTPISLIMHRNFASVQSDVDVATLASLLRDEGLDGVPVVGDSNTFEGFVSIRDLTRASAGVDVEDDGRLPVRAENGGTYELGTGWHAAQDADVTAGHLMHRDVPRLSESMPITVAAATMAYERLHCVPVVSEGNKLVGLVSALSILEWIAREDGYVLPRRTPRQPDPVPRIAGHRVLVADDDADMRRLVSHALRKDGCKVIEVADGAALLEYLGTCLLVNSHVARPEVIISDIRMPGFNGLEILAGLRHANWKLPIILMTALDDPKTHQDAARLGAAAFLQKPFDADHLRRTVRELLS